MKLKHCEKILKIDIKLGVVFELLWCGKVNIFKKSKKVLEKQGEIADFSLMSEGAKNAFKKR